MADQPKPKKRRITATPYDFDNDDPMFARPLSLAFEKKRAKKLLKQRANNGENDLKLTRVQFEIARENGFASWPAFSAHLQRAKTERDAIAGGQPSSLDAEKSTLHIRCGTDIENTLKSAGFSGDFIPFFDPFIIGPVRRTNSRDEFIKQRADFLVERGWINKTNAFKNHQAHYNALDKARDYQRVCLWFEHDSFDVLILAFLLDYFSDPARRPGQLQFVCATGFPGVEQFNGLGQLPPAALRVVWSWFKDVSDEQFVLGQQTWSAITQPSPQALMQLIENKTPAITPFAKALKRHLRELPQTSNGLSLVEHIALEVLTEHGTVRAGQLFGHYIKREPLPYLGDTMFQAMMENLADGANPAIKINQRTMKNPSTDEHLNWWRGHDICLTDTGKKLITGQENWLAITANTRWVGGIEINPQEPCWRWDETSQRPVYS